MVKLFVNYTTTSNDVYIKTKRITSVYVIYSYDIKYSVRETTIVYTRNPNIIY